MPVVSPFWSVTRAGFPSPSSLFVPRRPVAALARRRHRRHAPLRVEPVRPRHSTLRLLPLDLRVPPPPPGMHPLRLLAVAVGDLLAAQPAVPVDALLPVTGAPQGLRHRQLVVSIRVGPAPR